ncbi:hypothetical protein DPMN_140902 [Dreissena polymorpha]|uniref:Uncharacterized protein n=2 Tax=Dreissena polymorpha TaxID=45954 RepID=A0A9D4G8G9_DREPO|nr:hypothetical protein DPMN_140902 [Dreissena polymorpha]
MSLLLFCVRARGLAALQAFLKVLRATFHGWIADNILEAQIDKVGSLAAVGKISVREAINRLTAVDGQLRPTEEFPVTRFHPTTEYYHRHRPIPSVYYLNNQHHPEWEWNRNEQRNSRSSPERSRDGRGSPFRQIPENLRHLQKTFENEAAVTRKSLSILKQEEVTIKALLQQNLREQQEALLKQEALTQIKSQITEINSSAASLLKQDPGDHVTRRRLSLLQRVPWDVNAQTD